MSKILTKGLKVTKKSTAVLPVFLLASLGLVTSCTEVKKNEQSSILESVSVSEASKLEVEGKSTEASEMYSRIGEILLSKPEGVIHAQKMFKKSLELNANDSKANIYSSLLSPVLTTQGFLTRFSEVLQKSGKVDINASMQNLAKLNIKEFTEFALVMPSGKSEAKNFEDLRKFVRQEYVQELESSIKKLDSIKSEKIVLSYADLSSYSGKILTSTAMNEAAIAREVENASKVSNKEYTVDNYDIKALKIILKSQKNALTIASSVGLSGFEEVAEKIKSTSAKTDKEIIAAIRSQPNLLNIDGSKEDLREIFNSTEEVLNDLIDFSKISNEMCGSESKSTTLSSRICVTQAGADKINELLMFVVGPKSIIVGYDKNGEEVLVDLDLRALIDSRTSNLQELLPREFDANGKALNIVDHTFGGIIPNADLISKLKSVVK